MKWERHILLNPEVVCDDRMLTFAISVKVLTVECGDGRHAEVFNWWCDGGN